MFRSKHRRLCAPPFCAKNLSHDSIKCNSECGLVNSSQASKVCQKLTPAIKSIRFIEVEGLEKMAERNNLDLKIIFLARDPRGQYSSRLKIYDKNNTGDVKISDFQKKMIKYVCNHTKNIIEKREASPWLKKQSLVVKYEDLALNPDDKSKEILMFCGLNFTEKVSQWIKDNTESRTRRKRSGTYFCNF